MEDIVRVMRIIEYVGERSKVEEQLKGSMGDGTHTHGNGVTISIATLQSFAEILKSAQERLDAVNQAGASNG